MNLRKSNYIGKTMKTGTQTIPDQTMGMRELLDRHTRGVPLGVNTRQGEYFDTEITRFEDLTDMIEHKKMLKGKQRELNAQIKLAKEKQAKEQNAKVKEVEKSDSQKKATPKE